MTLHCLTAGQMAALVDGTAGEDQKKSLFQHVIGCDSCYETYLNLLEWKTTLAADEHPVPQADPGRLPATDPAELFQGDLDQPYQLPLAASDERPDLVHPQTTSAPDHAHISSQHYGLSANREISPEVHQAHPDTCAIKAQQLILKDFGVSLSEDQLRNEAKAQGWYLPAQGLHGGGTALNDIGKLLGAHGVGFHQVADANVYTLVHELAQGHAVIVDVNARSLHHPGFFQTLKSAFTGGSPDHALIVAGIDIDASGHTSVILKDPGTGEVARAYELDHFMQAWRDSNHFLVATNDPAPGIRHFNYTQGHIDHVGRFDYQDFDQVFTAEAGHQLAAGIPGELLVSHAPLPGNSLLIHKLLEVLDHYTHHHTGLTEHQEAPGTVYHDNGDHTH